jgi:putative endonuclease
LVERLVRNQQVRGSNPLASRLRSRREGERRLSRRSLGEGGHFGDLVNANVASYDSASQNNGKVLLRYILENEADRERFYTGLRLDLREHVKNHNSSRVRHTLKWRPWRLKGYIAFSDRARATEFERYLKSASGRAFAKNHF